MPAAYFHEAVARKAFERIGGAPQPEAVWILGAQGPDPVVLLPGAASQT